MVLEVLDKPESSFKDTKEYRTIKLDNGLVALLIADLKIPLDKIEAEETGESETNNLKKSAAGLCIGMGGFSDLEALPGIAHFLEHMVFMGSDKYPDESDFGFFINNHGGSYNASTDTEATIFQFDVQRKHFRKGLDRLAQFFTSPLLKKEAMAREREAVDSEFLMAIQNDEYAKCALVGSLSKEGHPMRNFLWGNKESLCPKDLDDDTIHKLLVEFKNRHYSAQYMTLVVQSQDSLENLQEMVLDLFSEVPNNGQKLETFGHLTDPFDTEEFNKIYKVVPIDSTYKIDINWAFPPLRSQYRVKPLKYLSFLVGHEGDGSLIAYLRDKALALDLSAGNSGYGFDNNSTCSIFSVGIELTQQGFVEIDSVMGYLYSYLSMILEKGTSARLYEEYQQIQQIDFDYGNESQVLDNVQTVCADMQFLPPKRYLDGDRLMFEFDQNLIQKCIHTLYNSSQVNVMISAKEFAGSANLIVPWFKAKYFTEDITKEVMAKWKSTNPPEGTFHLPLENKYIAQNMDLFRGEKNTAYPTRIEVSGPGELFYKMDSTFKLPRAHVYFHFCADLFQEGKPKDSVCLDLMVDIINQQLKKETYPASIAKLNFSLTTCDKGFILKIQGFNDKLGHLIQVIIDHILNFESRLTNDKFLVVREQTKKNYFNFFSKASKLVRDLRLTLLQDFYHGTQIRHSVIDSINIQKLTSFSQSFKAQAFIQCLVQGNVLVSQAKEYFQIATKISCDSKSTKPPKKIQCKEVPAGQRKIRMRGILPTDNNTFVSNYYQFGLGTIHSRALFDLLNMIMDEPVFDVLRTKEQLGYYVFSLPRNTHGILGLEVTVNSQENKFQVDYVEGRIEAFLKHFYDTEISEMKESKFQEYLEALIKKKTTSDITLEEEVERNWNEVTSRDYVFDRKLQEASIYRENRISLSDLKETVKKILIDSESIRKLSFQVVGVDKKVECGSDSSDLLCKQYVMELEVPENKDSFISNLCSFKENLSCYPIN